MKVNMEKLGFSNIYILPNCKELKILKENELVYATSKPFKLCTFSRVMKEKGIEDAVNAVEEINKKIVEYKIHKYCSNSRLHRLNSLSAFAKSTGVCLTNHKWRQSNNHDPQILHSISARSLQCCCTSFAFQIHADQVFS